MVKYVMLVQERLKQKQMAWLDKNYEYLAKYS